MSGKNGEWLGAGEGRTFLTLADRVTVKTSGAETNGAWSLFEVSAPPGSAVPLHRHAWTEAYFVLEGELEFQTEGGPKRAGVGAFVRMPPETVHGVKTSSPAAARYLLLVQPGSVEAFFAGLDEMTRSGNVEIPKVFALAAQHGLTVVM